MATYHRFIVITELENALSIPAPKGR
jgi:hypothetical protein